MRSTIPNASFRSSSTASGSRISQVKAVAVVFAAGHPGTLLDQGYGLGERLFLRPTTMTEAPAAARVPPHSLDRSPNRHR